MKGIRHAFIGYKTGAAAADSQPEEEVKYESLAQNDNQKGNEGDEAPVPDTAVVSDELKKKMKKRSYMPPDISIVMIIVCII